MLQQKTASGEDMPLIIAELSANHNGSLDTALKLVDAAASAGAHAVKLQTYRANTMTLNLDSEEFTNNDSDSPWFGQKLYSLYDQAHTPWEWHPIIAERAKEKGLLWFSSPFDETAVDFLENLDVPLYKIASFECVDLPLVRYVAQTGKPLIISTGMATEEEIGEAVQAVLDTGNQKLTLLHCTSSYPALPENANLKTIEDMRQKFGFPVGLSDHTLGDGVSIAATALGATVIEKHLTLSRAHGGPDSTFSTEPDEFRRMVSSITDCANSLGAVIYGPTATELGSVKRRRSIYVAKDMEKGETFAATNVRRVRPGHGLPPKFYPDILGKKAAANISAGTPLSWNLIEAETSDPLQ